MNANLVAVRPDTVSSKTLTTIIPVRIDGQNQYLIDRLSFLQLDPSAARFTDVLVVDDGSPEEYASRIEAVSAELGYAYLRLHTSHKLFSIGRARNAGAMRAKTPFIFMMDADLLPPVGFFRRLHEEIEILRLAQRSEDFVMVPVSYLTEAATADYLANQGGDRFSEFLTYAIDRNPTYVEKFSSGTSACLYSRHYYLSRGGNAEEFAGWGYEDLEFNLRMARLSRTFPTPADWNRDISSFDRQSEYRGWKSMYRMFGDRSFLKGILLFHAWHPVVDGTRYRDKRFQNVSLLQARIDEFVNTGKEPPPLPDRNRGRSLIFRKNPFTYSRNVRPLWGETVTMNEAEAPSDENLAATLNGLGIDRIVFHNPYANQEMRRIYDWARREHFPFVVCERGALNNSILFDDTGFLADSVRYSPEHWDEPLSSDEDRALSEYIQHETSSVQSLEAQAAKRLPAAELREELGLSAGEKIVLVCLQRPGDTATRFFPGALGSYGDFVWMVERISKTLPAGVRLAYKVHPLEDDAAPIRGLNVTPYHINDLFEIADKLVIYTSGTGVQAMMWGLPIVVGGNAFYRHDRLVHAPQTEEELREAIISPLIADVMAQRRFLHYLRFRYYSFGAFTTRPTRMEDGSRMNATTDIRFECVRGIGGFELNYINRDEPQDSWRSMLFDRYMGRKEPPKPEARAESRPPTAVVKTPKPPNLATRIYRGTRNVPVAKQVVDVFVPLYDRMKAKGSKS